MTVRQSNPFRRLRIQEGLSQHELARRAGVTKHAVLRLEQGMYDNPLPSVMEYFISYFDTTRSQLLNEYSAFQIAVREDNARLLGDIVTNLIERPVGTHPLKFLRIKAVPPLNGTQLAKSLCISQTVLNNFENKPMSQHTVPEQLLISLQDADYTEEETDQLVKSYKTYRNELIEDKDLKLLSVGQADSPGPSLMVTS